MEWLLFSYNFCGVEEGVFEDHLVYEYDWASGGNGFGFYCKRHHRITVALLFY